MLVKLIAGFLVAILFGLSALVGLLLRVFRPATVEGLVGLGVVLFFLKGIASIDRVVEEIKLRREERRVS